MIYKNYILFLTFKWLNLFKNTFYICDILTILYNDFDRRKG
jgi:hypothetical protein